MSKNWVRNTITYMFIFSLILVLFNLLIDPLQFYRSKEANSIYWTEERWQLPGLAKNYKYNTIILGTSMTENFVPSEVNGIFPRAKTLKLSIAGSSAYEQNKIAEIAFQNNQIDNVIWGLDYTSLSKDDFNKEEFPAFLYDNNQANDLKYLLNITTIKYSIISILYNITPKLAKITSAMIDFKDAPQRDLNSLYFWGGLYTYSKENVIADYSRKILEDKKNKKELLESFSFNRLKSSIDNNILPIVKNNPATHFYFYYPPYSILMNERFYELDPVIVDNIIKSREYFYSELNKYQNAKLFDFTTDKEITFNLNNYKDTMHHSPEINKYILKSLHDDRYLVTDNKLQLFLQEYRTQIKGFSMVQIN
ncbi:hypothetical protein [Paenibacillus cremeus]|uniref:Uncharacterized protein n=1 Tax=Paenibacillus cremeus TaxID=2163881 RepID=A0A559K0J1_9BACL|nr:hypothetical protein [Paenibacillus cremeus]TVY05641.1 hypothetical protein FPZ49_29135 [Paenibacillus cremeus]